MLVLVVAVSLALVWLAGCETDPQRSDSHVAAQVAAVGAAARDKPYQASVLRDPFHKASCRWAEKIATRNLRGYDDRQAAIDDGHRPCKVCKP